MTKTGSLAVLLATALLLGGCVTTSFSSVAPLAQIAVTDQPANEAAPQSPNIAAAEQQVVLPPGIGTRQLMEGTAQETTMYLMGTGEPGPVVLVLGGVHGDEPGGWLAADSVLDLTFSRGSMLVVPRANRQATYLGMRTTPELGDLNRLYPGNPEGLPMERMAHQIMDLVSEYKVNVLIDLHESWAFYNGRPANGTAFLGQTVSSYPNENGPVLAQAIVDAVNQKTIYPWEELFYREFPNRNNPTPPTGGSRSSLSVGMRHPGVAAILVEMGQQQSLARRIDLHVHVVDEALWLLSMRG
jgi:hypothetical protein